MKNKTNKIGVVIVDDEENSLSSLQILIQTKFSNLTILGSATNVEDAIKLINDVKPELLLLDISLPDGSGFDIIEKTSFKGYEVVFTTSYNNYAIQAFEFSALHYLLKPINQQKLASALERYKNFKTFDGIDYKLSIMRDSLNDKLDNILLSTNNGISMFSISEIVRCEASTQYTNVYFNNGSVLLVSKNLKNFDDLLINHSFVRPHNSHLINMKYFKKYVKTKPSYIVMKDRSEIPVSENLRDQFISSLEKFANKI